MPVHLPSHRRDGTLGPMNYRRFGRTELAMPVFSCGGMRYQHQWQDIPWSEVPPAGQANLEATIHRSIELGINHIETARGYGSSEMQLGPVLRQFPREKLIVQTKVMPKATAGEFLQTFDTSMNYLGLDYVDLLSLHGINHAEHLEWALRPGGCVDAAEKLRAAGRCRFIGFSTHATPEVILAAIQSNRFDYVNLHWYFVNDLNWGCVQEAKRLDMGVFIISPNDKGGQLYRPLPKMRSLCAPLTPMQFNDLYCLARPEVHTLSLGAARPSDFDEHIAGLEFYERAAEVIAPIEVRLRAEMEKVLGADWCQRWTEGLPEYHGIPGEINILEILRLWTYGKPLELIEWGKARYNLLGSGDHWFPGNHMAHAVQTKLEEVLKASPFAARLPEILEEAHGMFFDAPVKRLSQS
jgi:predicted aldo/keto reductase-like oxidoreductase